MRPSATAATALLMLVSCSTNAGTGPRLGRPPVGLVAPAQLPDLPAHADATARDLPSPDVIDAHDPVIVAVDHILRALRGSDRGILDVGSEVVTQTANTATVRTAVWHVDSVGREHAWVYEVELTRTADGTWLVVNAQPVS